MKKERPMVPGGHRIALLSQALEPAAPVPSPQPLASLAADHPCLWGERQLASDASWVLEPSGTLMPTRRTGKGGVRWWDARKQGGLTGAGQPIEALTDVRGARQIYPLAADPGTVATSPARIKRQVLLYGGSLFDHFGHMIVDLSRTYQLLRLFRNSSEPIWFHYPGQIYSSEQNTNNGTANAIANPLIEEWLRCLGIRKRARLIRKKTQGAMLVSSSVLYRDRAFVTADFPRAARAALAPKLRRRLLGVEPLPGRLAYLSRHRLQGGTTCFEGEQEVVDALARLPNVDVICAEELSIRAKLKLFRRYRLITGFPQAAMLLKYFVPHRSPADLAKLALFTAGPRSLNSNWVNFERAFGFGDEVLDCTPAGTDQNQEASADPPAPGQGEVFQRHNSFQVGVVVDRLRALAAS
jgi:hypothetical protein